MLQESNVLQWMSKFDPSLKYNTCSLYRKLDCHINGRLESQHFRELTAQFRDSLSASVESNHKYDA